MENPLEQPAPDDVIERVHVFARDLAYGVVKKMWGAEISVDHNRGTIIGWSQWGGDAKKFNQYMEIKWKDKLPDDQLLFTFGYLHQIKDRRYILSSKAFELLEKPATSPSVFISYGHKQSSELALLIEARLRYVDKQIGIFIDKSIPLAEDWYQHLEEQVKQSEYFICLLGQVCMGCNDNKELIFDKTIDRDAVQKEITWAIESDKKIIFICHRGFTLPTKQSDIQISTWTLIQSLSTKQGVFIEQESAEDYETAINKLLNQLQYPTF